MEKESDFKKKCQACFDKIKRFLKLGNNHKAMESKEEILNSLKEWEEHKRIANSRIYILRHLVESISNEERIIKRAKK